MLIPRQTMRPILKRLTVVALGAEFGLVPAGTACSVPVPEAGAGPPAATAELAPAEAGVQSPGPVLRLERRTVEDRQGFGTEAFSLLLPHGWEFSGDLRWEIQPGGIPRPVLQFEGRSPDGSAAVAMQPDQIFAHADDPMLQASLASQGTRMLPVMSLRDYWTSRLLPDRRQEMEALQMRRWIDLPEEAARQRQLNEYLINRVFHSISPFPILPRHRSEAALVEVEGRWQGRPCLETQFLVLDHAQIPMPGMFGPVNLTHWVVHSITVRVERSRAEEFAGLAPVILRSARPNLRWLVDTTRLTADLTRQALQNQQAIFDRMRQISRTLSEIDDLIVDGYARRSKALDRVFDDYSQAVRGVDSYVVPGTDAEPVELPLGYEQVWTNGREYLLTNQPGFDPNEAEPHTWTRMEPVRR